jgi:hypothetical protein
MLETRIEILNALVHDIDIINMDKFKVILDDQYDSFVDFCVYVKSHPEEIVSISCSLIRDNEIEFDTIDKNGTFKIYNHE